MPNSKIFCNSPWYELHIYWDGSLGFCCQESHKIYSQKDASKYNLRNMSIQEWMDSQPMRNARLAMFGNDKNSFCSKCYVEESVSESSRRHRCNQKSVIFTRTAFTDSYLQSPGHNKFEISKSSDGAYNGMPIDLHIDLGNYCNLTCKMCNPRASSGIAAQHVKWKIQDAAQYIGTDWTQDSVVWNRTLMEISSIRDLKNIHFMGGETLITRRFEEFVDYMIEQGRLDLNFSFVTNGTKFNDSLIKKLLKFNRVGIEVSIETLTDHNAYQRQGTDNTVVLKNIDRYLDYCDNERVTVTARPAISLLTIGYYDTLLEYCLKKNIIVKSLLCDTPAYYSAGILPDDVKQLYLAKYENFLIKYALDEIDCTVDYNESDPNQISQIIKNQVLQCMNVLRNKRPDNADTLLGEMVSWCRRWDSVHNYDAYLLYPELREVFKKYGY